MEGDTAASLYVIDPTTGALRQAGQANGIATTGADGRLSADEIPTSIANGLTFQATWNAATNTPTLPPVSTPDPGDFWIVTVAGSTALPGAAGPWTVGQCAVFNGVDWDVLVMYPLALGLPVAGASTGWVLYVDSGGLLQTAATGSTSGVQAYSAALAAIATNGTPTAWGLARMLDAGQSANRTALALVPGTDVQAYSANLTIYAGITPSANVQSYLAAADYAAMRTLLSLVPGTNIPTGTGSATNTNTGDQTFTASGDATAPGNTSNLALTLATVNSNVGSFGSSTEVPVLTLDGKGRVTAASTATVTTTAIGAVPTTRTVNGHALSADVTVTKGDVGLGNVENTALSTWAGSTSLTTLGTIGTGVWQGTTIKRAYNGYEVVTSASDPTVNDDSGDGYAVGQVWVNTTSKLPYMLADATVGAAVWRLLLGFGSRLKLYVSGGTAYAQKQVATNAALTTWVDFGSPVAADSVTATLSGSTITVASGTTTATPSAAFYVAWKIDGTGGLALDWTAQGTVLGAQYTGMPSQTHGFAGVGWWTSTPGAGVLQFAGLQEEGATDQFIRTSGNNIWTNSGSLSSLVSVRMVNSVMSTSFQAALINGEYGGGSVFAATISSSTGSLSGLQVGFIVGRNGTTAGTATTTPVAYVSGGSVV